MKDLLDGGRRAVRVGASESVIRRPSSAPRAALVCAALLPVAFCLFTPAAAAAEVWVKQNSGTLAWLRGVHFSDERAGWAVGGRGVVLRTTDGGESWRLMPRPTEDTLRDVFFTDASTGWIVCDKDDFAPRAAGEPRSYLMRTTDAGLSWSRVRATGADSEVRLTRVVFADARHGWAFGEAGALYATRDGGDTWSRQTLPTRRLLLGGAFLDARRGWIVGAGATFVQTADGGDTWRAGRLEESTREAATGNDTGRADDARASSVAARVAASNVAPPQVSSASRVNAVSFADARHGLAVGSGGRVFSTEDGGRTWRAQSAGAGANLHDVKLFEGGEAWAAGEGGTLLHSRDGGARWERVQAPTTLRLERLSFAGRGRAWAVGFGGVVLALRPAHAPGLRQVSSR